MCISNQQEIDPFATVKIHNKIWNDKVIWKAFFSAPLSSSNAHYPPTSLNKSDFLILENSMHNIYLQLKPTRELNVIYKHPKCKHFYHELRNNSGINTDFVSPVKQMLKVIGVTLDLLRNGL